MTPQAWVLIFTGIVLAIVCVCAFMRCKSSVREPDELVQVTWSPAEVKTIDELLEDCRQSTALVDKCLRAYDPEPLPTGWQGWEGGEQPICSGTRIIIMQRNGVMVEAYADAVRWWHVGDIDPSLYSADYDIVAWRVAD